MILNFTKVEGTRPFVMALLDLICESSSWGLVEIISPCRPEPHSIHSNAFLLLEEVEFAKSEVEWKLVSLWRLALSYLLPSEEGDCGLS